MTVQLWVADISKDDRIQFSEIFSNCFYYLLAADSTNITSNCDFETSEETVDPHSRQR